MFHYKGDEVMIQTEIIPNLVRAYPYRLRTLPDRHSGLRLFCRTLASFFRPIIFISLLVVGTPSAFACLQNNHIRPFDVVSDEVHKAWVKKDFKKLEAWAQEYGVKGSRTSDGYSPLMAFYQGISDGFNNCAKTHQKSEKEWLYQEERLKEWQNAYPDSLAAKLALAFFTTNYAWHARGNGYANTVGDSDWARFNERIESARNQLEAIASPCENNPAWYDAMLSIALAQAWPREEFERIYRKGVELDPYYVGLYYARTNYLLPQWYGSYREYHEAIDEAVQATRKRLGEALYAKLHWTYSDVKQMFESGRVDWHRMKNGFEDSLHAFPDKWTRNNFARFACEANDPVTLKRELDKLGDNIMPEAWFSTEYLTYCKAYAKTTPGGKPVKCFKREDTGEVICE